MEKRTICVLEGEWENKLEDLKSVRPAMEYLKVAYDIPFAHRRIPTKESLFRYLDAGISQKYRIFYLASHGEKETLCLGVSEWENVSLDDLEAHLNNRFGYNDVAIHFGGCSILNIDQKKILEFKEKTHARLVSGYLKNIDFLDSMLLEMAYFAFLQNKGAFGSIDRFIKGEYSGLINKLGFIIY